MAGKLRILMVAYACDPAGGGEHWLGWGWANEVSREHDVVVLTTSRGISALLPAAEQRGIEIHCIDVPGWVRKAGDIMPGIGAWFRKIWWQGMALAKARQLHSVRSFDLTHQTTFHTFRVPFACARLGVPSVWGPVAGGEAVPAGFDLYLGESAAAAERKRGILNRLCLRMPWVRKSLADASRIIVSNRTTLEFLPKELHAKCVVISPNALRNEDIEEDVADFKAPEKFTLLFAGNCAPTRAMPLVFEALAEGLPVDWHLRVVGAGAALDFWKQEVERLGLGNQVEFTGPVPRPRLQQFYRDTSVLVFPGLRDSGGSALLEAMTLGLPILTLDWGGPGEMVDRESAVLVKPETPAQTISEIREGLIHLAKNPQAGYQLGRAARQRALKHFSWQSKVQMIDSVYRELAG